MHVTIYTKPGCHLCEDALVLLDRLMPEYGLEVQEVNILDDLTLYDAYHEKIPVIKIEDGRLGTLEAPVDEASLRAAFDIARRAYPAGTSVLPKPPREPLIDRVTSYIGRHWLHFAAVGLGTFVMLPWLAPVFAALGWWDLANPIYTAYAFQCHQLPERCGHVFGYEAGQCWRCSALYGGMFLFTLVFARSRGTASMRWFHRSLPVWAFILLLLPMLIDGVTHLAGVRDPSPPITQASFDSFWVGSQTLSLNWTLRMITGLVAALGSVWFAFPRMERTVQESEKWRMMYLQSKGML